MEQQAHNPESGYRINNLMLIENFFKRTPIITLDRSLINHNINVDVSTRVTNNSVIVTETLEFQQKKEETIEIECKIVMVGVFEKIGETPLDLDQFGKINGAAIIYPYIREHLSSLSAKAGTGLILLPPMNFTKKKID